MADSILQWDTRVCFLCGRNANLESLDKHHVFGKYNRAKSEAYGLTIYLHHSKCHINGKDSVHKNAEIDKSVKRYAQYKAMEKFGWSQQDFIDRFGKNYID